MFQAVFGPLKPDEPASNAAIAAIIRNKDIAKYNAQRLQFLEHLAGTDKKDEESDARGLKRQKMQMR